MERINDGGPAFPLPLGNEDIDPSVSGMTLRDYFAAKAMAALIGQTGTEMADQAMIDNGFGNGQVDRLVAKCAYDYADAMLQARKVKS